MFEWTLTASFLFLAKCMDVSVSKLLEISSILFADLEKEDRSYFKYLAFFL